MTGDARPERPTPPQARIAVECLNCGRSSTLDDAASAGASLVGLTRRLRCSACGSRAVKAARVGTPRDVARLLGARIKSGRG